jgi:NADH:ubiquinone reductase (H+-translocating)
MIERWRAESALVARPFDKVEVRRIPPGGYPFVRALSQREMVSAAIDAAVAAAPHFDIAVNLAFLMKPMSSSAFAGEPAPSHEQKQVSQMMTSATQPRSRVVIIGAGFGGLSAAKKLAHASFEVTIVDRHNYHLFQPLLYQVATAGLSPGDIASPIRGILRGQENAQVILAKVSGVDTARREVLAEGRRIPYDYLIVATGAEHAYFGHDWSSYAPGLKTIDDATYLRRRILLAFERAEIEPDPNERRRLLNFVVVGGGPTGVEMAGAIAELAKRALASDFRSIDPRCAQVILVEAGPRLLGPFDPALSEAARRSLEQLGVEVRLGVGVSDCNCFGVSLGQERLQTRTIIWAAGVKASPAAEWLGADCDRAGRVKVKTDLSLSGHPNIFVIGDAAAVTGSDGKSLPGVAPVAKQQGWYVANLLMARAAGKTLPAFRYRDFGSMATIGRKRAVAQLGAFKVSGLLAWLLWSLAHVYFLIGFRNRLAVAMNWGWSYVTFQRGTRLITGISGSRIEDVMPVVMTASSMAADAVDPVAGPQALSRTRKMPHSDNIDRERAILAAPYSDS